jgi:hypothetical protein
LKPKIKIKPVIATIMDTHINPEIRSAKLIFVILFIIAVIPVNAVTPDTNATFIPPQEKQQDPAIFFENYSETVTLIPPASENPQYSCFDFDPVIYGKSIQTSVSQDGQFIVAGDPDSGIISLVYPNGSPRWSYRTGDNITGVAISRDGRFVSAATYHGNLYYFDNPGNLLWHKTGLGCNNQVELSHDGFKGFVFNSGTKDFAESDTVFSFDWNGTILWGKSVPHLSVAGITSDAQNAFLGTRGQYGNDVILLSGDGSEEWRKNLPGGWKVSGVALSDDGTTIAAITDNKIFIFSNGGKILANITPKYIVRSIAVSPDGMEVVAGTQYNLLCFNRSGIALWDYPVDDYLYHLKFSQDGQTLIASSDDTLSYFDRNGTVLWKIPLGKKVESLSLSRDAATITAGTYDDSFFVMDPAGNVTEINAGSFPAKSLPVSEPGSVISPPDFPDNRSGPLPTTSSPVPGFLIIIALVAVCGISIGLKKTGS